MIVRVRHRLPAIGRGRGMLALVALLGVAWLLPASVPSARAAEPPRLEAFLWGLAGQESGWDWYARNSWSGAFGRYQIMPSNWPSWAATYLGDRWADQSPVNQARVARGKIADLHRWLGSWRRVAYWWLTGDTERDSRRWSSVARGYVHNVLTLMGRAPRGGDPMPQDTARGGPPASRGDWRMVAGRGYLFDRPDRSRHRVSRIRDGQVLFVIGSRWGRRGALWMKVSTRSGRIGWVSIRRTLPAHKPPAAYQWPRGRDTGTPERDDEQRRERARPRPR